MEALKNFNFYGNPLHKPTKCKKSLVDLFIFLYPNYEEKKGKKKMLTTTNKKKMKSKDKVLGKEKNEYLRRKFQNAVETLKKKDNDEVSLDEKEEDESEEELEFPEVIGVSLDLSKRKMKEFPLTLLNKMNKVQYLYLEGNKLTELPESFFQHLYFLKWLDLRNNSLTSLPTNGLKFHNCLENILLQGNQIRNLPVELATIPSLKGIQITGNPIKNIPPEVIAGGFQQVIKHLEKLRTQDKILLPVSDTIVVKPSNQDNTVENPKTEVNEPTDAELRMWDLEKLSQWRQFIKKRSRNPESFKIGYPSMKNTNEKPVLQQPKISVSLRSQLKLPNKPQPFRCGTYNKNRRKTTAAALRYLKTRKTRLGYKRKPITVAMIQEKARNEAYKAQMREILEKQAKKIQRMRDKEILKNWRDHSRLTREQIKLLDNYQEYPSKGFADKTPFDVDPEFLNMLNRVDLYRSLKDYDNRSKRNKKPRVRITALDLERQMNEIMKKLQQLDTNDSANNTSPRTKQGHMCNKINQIMDIQKTLKSLQTLNSSMNGIMPLIKTKPKD